MGKRSTGRALESIAEMLEMIAIKEQPKPVSLLPWFQYVSAPKTEPSSNRPKETQFKIFMKKVANSF
jgi:hypothetical protein